MKYRARDQMFQCFAVFSILRGSMAQWLSVTIEANAGTISYMTGDVLCALIY